MGFIFVSIYSSNAESDYKGSQNSTRIYHAAITHRRVGDGRGRERAAIGDLNSIAAWFIWEGNIWRFPLDSPPCYVYLYWKVCAVTYVTLESTQKRRVQFFLRIGIGLLQLVVSLLILEQDMANMCRQECTRRLLKSCVFHNFSAAMMKSFQRRWRCGRRL